MKIRLHHYLLLLCPLSPMALSEEVPQSIHKLVPTLEKLGSESKLISAVKAQNSQNISLDTIKQRDADWRSTSGVNDFMNSLLNNDAAQWMTQYEASEPYYLELFLMDNQGANVAMTSKTSDYWQGDEAKWQESFKGGSGAVHIGEVEFDESAQAYLVQVSVPIMEAGKAIGAMTIGINLDELGE